jgi:hypothetical protein
MVPRLVRRLRRKPESRPHRRGRWPRPGHTGR